MSKKILVTGGTGALGRHVVRLLRQAGHEVRVTSRRTADDLYTVDWKTGAGLREALYGVEVVVHCAYQFAKNDLDRKLIEAARRADVQHLLYISIVGIDQIPFRYYRTKLAAERLIEQSGLPWTILRATQFHELMVQVLGTLGKSPVVLLPDLAFQPIAGEEVAERLAELAVGPPAGRVPDLGGPEVHDVTTMARMYLSKRRPSLRFRLPGKTFRAFRAGWHHAPEHADGKVTFAEYVEALADKR